jgi:hypothetical protein
MDLQMVMAFYIACFLKMVVRNTTFYDPGDFEAGEASKVTHA